MQLEVQVKITTPAFRAHRTDLPPCYYDIAHLDKLATQVQVLRYESILRRQGRNLVGYLDIWPALGAPGNRSNYSSPNRQNWSAVGFLVV